MHCIKSGWEELEKDLGRAGDEGFGARVVVNVDAEAGDELVSESRDIRRNLE